MNEVIARLHGVNAGMHARVNQTRQVLTERGYGDLLIACYPTLRKYFADFIQLPFAAGSGSEPLMQAIELGECWRSSTFIGLRNRSLRRHAWSNPFWFSA
ncbi:hypothetical protein KFU94_27055 [Chloroflexi bacterium TSY]|nr:hypothetical protein [Chloroflexi bacterium TSY]